MLVPDPHLVLAAHAAAEYLRGPLNWLGDHVAYDLVRTGAFRLWDRIRNDPDAARNAALRNARAYTVELAQTLNRARDEGRITGEQIARALASPAAVRVLEAAIISASTTDSNEVHAELATLVSARLASTDDSALGDLIHDACIKLESLKPRHLRILAIVYLCRYAEPPPIDEALDQHGQGLHLLRELRTAVQACGAPQFEYQDARYLESLGVADYRGGYGSRNSADTPALAQAIYGRINDPGAELPEDVASIFEWVRLATQMTFDSTNVDNMHLPLVGLLIGQVALCRMIGEEPNLSTYG